MCDQHEAQDRDDIDQPPAVEEPAQRPRQPIRVAKVTGRVPRIPLRSVRSDGARGGTGRVPLRSTEVRPYGSR